MGRWVTHRGDGWSGAARLTGWSVSLALLGSVLSGTAGSAVAAARLGPSSVHGPRTVSTAGASSYRDDTVLAGFKPGVSQLVEKQVLAEAGVQPIQTIGDDTVLLSVPVGRVQATVTALSANELVRYAEPDYRSTVAAVPNDPSFSSQWAFQNTGQTVSGVTGTPGADEHAVAAWNVTKGSPSIVIGEVDTGVDYTHPDLAANIWSNPGGINGCSAGTHGYNILNSTCDPMDDDSQYGGHGTHVAGIMGAVGNNGVGVTGVNWSTSILPVKWVDSSGNGYTSGLIQALDWLLSAKRAGVNIRVINDSDVFYGTAYSQALADEISLLGQNGILFVTAAGNTSDNNDNPAVRRYPCGYDLSNEICVAATDQNDALASWSNYGATSVDLAAPGDNIYSTLRGGGYGYISGTSMAAPQVSGTAALILSVGGSLTPSQLKARILETADPLPSLLGKVRTGARLDVCAAVPGCGTSAAPTKPFSVTAPPVSTATAGPEPQAGTGLTAGTGDWDPAASAYSYQWQRCSSTATACATINGATASTYTPGQSDVGGTLQVAVTATNSAGSTTAFSTPTQVVQAPSSGQTFGKTTVGASSDLATADYERVDAFQAPVAGPVTKLTVYLSRAASGAQVFKGLVYSDTGGTPGSLLGVSNALTFGSSAASGWYDLAFPTPVNLQAAPYWIGIQAGGTSNVAALQYDEATANSGAVASAPYANGPLNPFGTAALQTEQFSIYATYASAPSTGLVGTTTVGPNSDTMSANRKRVNSVQVASAVHVTSLSLYLQPTSTSGSQVLEGVVYADSKGRPGALLGTTAVLTFSSSQTAGWYGLTFKSPLTLTAGAYWIGVLTGGTSGVAGFRWTNMTGSRAWNSNTYSKGPSNPFGSATVDSELMSLYATYTN